MSVVALILASASFVFSILSLRRQQASRRPGGGRSRSGLDADEMLHAAWIEELEAKGEEVLRRIADAEARWARRKETRPSPASAAGGGLDTPTTEDAPPPRKEPTVAAGTVPPESDFELEDSRRSRNVVEKVRELAAAGVDASTIARRLHIGR